MYTNKTIKYALIGLVAIIFLSYFTIQHSMFESGKVIDDYLDKISTEAEAENWVLAERNMTEFKNYWDKVKYFVALNNAEQDFSDFEQAVHKMEGAVKTKESSEVISLSVQAKELWRNFMRVVPLP